MSFLSTVKIKVAPCKGNEAGIVVMNEADYDPAKHELYDPAKEAALKADAEAKKAEKEKAEAEQLEKEKAEKEQAEKEQSQPAKAEEQPMTFEDFKGKRGKK